MPARGQLRDDAAVLGVQFYLRRDDVDRMRRPSSTTAMAVSSQEVSMPSTFKLLNPGENVVISPQ